MREECYILDWLLMSVLPFRKAMGFGIFARRVPIASAKEQRDLKFRGLTNTGVKCHLHEKTSKNCAVILKRSEIINSDTIIYM